MRRYSVLVVALVGLSSCTQNIHPNQKPVADLNQAGMSRLVKSDIDEVIEIHQQALINDLKQLMIKLYRRNPNQRIDKDMRSIEQSVDLVFGRSFDYQYPHWEAKTGSEMIRLALDPGYQVNDRILPFIVGLRKMLMAAYDNRTEFFYLDSLDEQKLYNSARNIEIAAWLLAVKRNQKGELLIVSDSLTSESRNLSFQRLIGRLIATQDNLATIISYKEGRIIKTAIVKAASMLFFPI